MLIRFLQPSDPIDYASATLVSEQEFIPIPAVSLPPNTDHSPSAPDQQLVAVQQQQGRFLTPVTFGGQMPRTLFAPAASIAPDTLLFGRMSRPPLSGRISKKTL